MGRKKHSLARTKQHARKPIVTQNIARVLKLFHVPRPQYTVIASDDPASINMETARQSLHILFETNVEYRVTPEGTMTSSLPEKGQDGNSSTVQGSDGLPSSMRHLRTMSLFCGAGGIDVGFSARHNMAVYKDIKEVDVKSGHFCTRWALDFCKDACNTFRGHHADTSKTAVLNVDVGKALQMRKRLRVMPKDCKGRVDVIILGPPCQPFTGLNRSSSKRNDPRALLIATSLSYVDIYRPSYGILENVPGILRRGDLGSVKKSGIVMFLRAALLAMGYQMRVTEVQCQNFGIPQSLTCVIVLFASVDLTLPAAPQSCGKIGTVTVDDVISDLPRWEYSNPHRVYASEDSLPEARSLSLQPPRHCVKPENGLPKAEMTIGPRHCTYVSIPKNAFQARARATFISQATRLTQHQTIALDDFRIERICNVPCEPGANHLSWLAGRDALSGGLSETPDEGAYENAFGRLDKNGIFSTMTRRIGLASKTGRLLMPDQHRIPTFRELARVQGFPDAIQFCGAPAKIVEQIGNAVPPPLAEAIGVSIERAAAFDWYERGERRFARHPCATSKAVGNM